MLVIGHNPSEHSWASGWSYSNPSNNFWRLLVKGAIVPEDWSAEDCPRLPGELGVGFTDAGCVPGSDAARFGRATMREWRADLYARLRGHLCRASGYDFGDGDEDTEDAVPVPGDTVSVPGDDSAAAAAAARGYGPAIVAFAGKRQYGQLFDAVPSSVRAGRQDSNSLPPGWPFCPESTEVWVLPSSSGRAAMTREAREGPYVELGRRLAESRWPRDDVHVGEGVGERERPGATRRIVDGATTTRRGVVDSARAHGRDAKLCETSVEASSSCPTRILVVVCRIRRTAWSRQCATRRRRRRVRDAAIASRARVFASVVVSLLDAGMLVLGGVRGVFTDDGTLAIELVTKDAVAREMDTYTYTSAAMPDEPHYIARFEPKADMSKVHHMLLFGCEGLAASTKTRSGGMFSGGGQARGTLCLDSASEPFLFGWGMNAPDLVLPDNVGFRVGPGGFRHLVLEVHYLVPQPRTPPASPDSSLISAPGRPRQTHVRHSVRPGIHPPSPPRTRRRAQHVLLRRRATFRGVRVSRPHPRPRTRGIPRAHDRGGGLPRFRNRRHRERHRERRSPPTRLMGRDPQLPQLFERLETRVTIRPGDKFARRVRSTLGIERRRLEPGGATATRCVTCT